MKNKEVNKAEATCINSSSFFYLLPIFRILLPIKRCDLPSNSLVWWQHKNTSNFQKMCTILKNLLKQLVQLVYIYIWSFFTIQILYLHRKNCQKTLLFWTTMQHLIKGAKSQFLIVLKSILSLKRIEKTYNERLFHCNSQCVIL